MDYSLVSDEARRKYFSEKGSYSAVDEAGRPLINKDMDVALLMTYGHILYTGTSYTYALSEYSKKKKKRIRLWLIALYRLLFSCLRA